jgi:P-type Na+/K+ transporter
MAISFGILDWIEAGVIVGVICVNVGMGFYQEFTAEKSMESLRSLSSPSATVIRNGKMEVIPK